MRPLRKHFLRPWSTHRKEYLAKMGKVYNLFPMIRIVLYQPEIPSNVGALLRLSACWGFPLEIVGPLPFVWSHRHLKRSAMDYLSHATYRLYTSWQTYLEMHRSLRKVFLLPHGRLDYADFSFSSEDCLVIGRESTGFPKEVEDQADESVRIPMVPRGRSLNMAMAAAVVMGEALRQTQQFPKSL